MGNASAYGFSGSVTLPTSAPGYQQPAFIHVVATLTSGATDEVCPAMPAGTTTFQGAIKYLQDGASHNINIQFQCENADGLITPSPFSVAVSVNASGVASVTASEAANALTVDPATRQVHTSAVVQGWPDTPRHCSRPELFGRARQSRDSAVRRHG